MASSAPSLARCDLSASRCCPASLLPGRSRSEEADHVSTAILTSAIAPVLLVLALGYAAGKHHSFSADQAKGLSRLALAYALPAALFLGMAHFNRALLLQQ